MRKVKASFTVELTFLMIIILPVLFGIIYMGFYLHNNALMNNAAYEIAIYANLQEEEKRTQTMEAKKQEVLNGKLIAAKDISGQIEINDKLVVVTFTGFMETPGMILKILGYETLPLQGSAKLPIQNPGKTVVMINSLKKVVEGVKSE